MYLRTGICEDHPEELALLLQALKNSPCDCETKAFSGGEDFLKNFFPGCFDLILMDIYMNGINGVETVARIRAADPDVTIAFMTTSSDFTMEGYQYRVDRYLLKPIKQKELDELLSLAARNKKNRPSVAVSVQGRRQDICLTDICFAEQNAHTLYIHLADGQILRTAMKLSDLAATLPEPPFFRCHKSFLVNLVHVRYLENDLKAFIMNGNGCAYIRRDSLRQARDMYSRFMFEQVRGKESE